MDAEAKNKSLPVETETELEFLKGLKPFLDSCLQLNHDLNNQLSGIFGYVEFVLYEPGQMSSDQIDLLNKALICAEKIKKQLEQFCIEKNKLGHPIEVEALIKKFSSSSIE